MANIKNNEIVISGGIIFRDNRRKRQYLLVRNKEQKEWELPKTTVRKGESSVRAVLRMAGESGGMNTRILEEAGRASGTVNLNGKVVKQRHYYYLVMAKSTGEILGFEDYQWGDYSQTLKKMSLKREQEIFKDAKEIYKIWEETKSHKKQDEMELS